MKTKQDLIDYLYNENGRARVPRFKKAHLEANGFSDRYEAAINACNDVGLASIDDAAKLRAYCKDKVYLPHCKTCGTEYVLWSNKHQDWSKFCSQSCTQNDPDTKKKMVESLAEVDWDATIQKRKDTMIEKYGIESWSQTEDAKQALATRTKESWADEDQKNARLEARKESNLSKYGYEHTSQVPEIKKKMADGIREAYTNKDTSERESIRDLYRKNRLNEYAHSVLTSYDELYRLYITEQKSILGISRLLECSESAVVFAIHDHGIEYDPTRSQASVSDAEIELYQFIMSLDDTAIQTYKDTKHLDIFIPSRNLGFEFNGVYWHSELKKHKEYHADKVDYFYERGIRYIQVWEDDWTNRRDVVERFIKNLLGLNSRIGARKTTVRELTQSEFDTFMDTNHMQGTTRCGIRLGLVYDGMVVSAMGFKEIPSNIKSVSTGKGADLVRFANINVTGAFTKLLSFFEKNYPFDYITSFGDLELVDRRSNVYTKNGFVEVNRIEPDYRYYDYRTNKREHKFSYRKSNFERLGLQIEGKTERELAKEYKLLRCYDSGKIMYLKTK